MHCNAFTSLWGLGLWHNSVLMQHKIRTRFKRQNVLCHLSHPPLSTKSFFFFLWERGREKVKRRKREENRAEWEEERSENEVKGKEGKEKCRIYSRLSVCVFVSSSTLFHRVHLRVSVSPLCLGKHVDIRFYISEHFCFATSTEVEKTDETLKVLPKTISLDVSTLPHTLTPHSYPWECRLCSRLRWL